MKRIGRGGFTLVEIMIVVAIIALLAAIAIPNVLRGRATANESAATGNFRALVNALEMYRSTNNEYASAWQADLYTNPEPDYGPPSFDLNLASAQAVQGYNYIYARTAAQTYTLDAYPTATTNGTRAFFVNETGVVRHCRCPAAGCSATVNAVATSNTLDALPGVCA
ncbi:MAG: prepilin-type N-terminal cleavage/methylation domain-containing protein [Candidatus Omnitrophica bacterium]|nr:prepilin-type N-terminal cleavage/methylation domain-containing protein [Candidatus Omnitrophota bacterium]